MNVLSAHLSDSPYALTEKNAWLDKHLPEVDAAHRIFPPCGQDKANYIPNGLRTTDYLLDDYTKNLAAWEPPAKGIKVLNGINHTHGTWKSACLRFDKPARELAQNITDTMKGVEQIVDNTRQKFERRETSFEGKNKPSFCAEEFSAFSAPASGTKTNSSPISNDFTFQPQKKADVWLMNNKQTSLFEAIEY